MDNLPEKLSELVDIQSQVNFLNNSARQIVQESPRNLPRAIAMCELASELSTQETDGQPLYQIGLAESLANLGEFYVQFSNYDLALSFLFKALNTLELLDIPAAAASVLNWIGVTYGYLSEYSEALAHYLKAQEIYHQIGDRLAQASVLNNVGQVYLQLEDPDRSLEFLNQSLLLLEDTGAINEQAEVLRSLCQVHSQRGEFERALSFGLRSANLYHQAEDSLGQSQVLISMGDLYRSVHLYTRAMPGAASTGSQLLSQHTLVNDWGIPNNALDSYHAALDLARKVEAKFDMVTALIRLGETYLEDPIPGLNAADRLGQAQGYLEMALETGRQINARQLVFETHRLLAEVYKHQGEYQQALEHFEHFHILREEVFNRESANRLRNLEIVHQVDAARKQTELSRLKNITLQEEIRQRQAAQLELEETNRQLQDEIHEKEQLIADLNAFSHMVAHDLKNPLTNIAISAGLVKYEFERLAVPADQKGSSENLDRIVWMVSKMNRIINELLVLASVRDEEIYAEPLNMEQIVSDVERRLNYLFQETKASLNKTQSWPAALGHAPWVEEIWANYISNAIQYGGCPPCLEIGAEILDSPVDLPVMDEDGEEPILVPTAMVRFWVRDHGDGIPPDQQEFVFSPFGARRLHTAQGDAPTRRSSNGHGLGLSIVRRIVEKLDGRVGIESTGKPGEGSLFYFTLPAAPPKL